MPYSSVTVTGYNNNPPSDDGSATEANEIRWSYHKEKLGDPLKTAIESTQTNIASVVTDLEAEDAALKKTQRGHIFGLQMTNDTDTANDISITAGQAASDNSPYELMQLSSAIVKRVDATWVVGDGNGGLDAGSVNSTDTYHVFLIMRSDTGVVDALFSTSPTTPTMPSNYDYYRRIGSIKRNNDSFEQFQQYGDFFYFTSAVSKYNSGTLDDYSDSVTTSRTTLTMNSLPADIKVEANVIAYAGDTTQRYILVVGGDHDDDAAAQNVSTLINNSTATFWGESQLKLWTNTSAQIYARSSGSTTAVYIYRFGWTDYRNQHFIS